jgi:1,4-alpha-glucan branching enzyme
MAHQLAAYVTKMGFTHVELMPVTEHPFYGSWGYQTTGYFAPTARYGTPQDLMVPGGHAAPAGHRRAAGLGAFALPVRPARAGALRRHARCTSTRIRAWASTREWNSLIFNYGRYEVRDFLISNALFWLEKYHFDGLRVDAVASMLYLDYARKPGEWIPNQPRRQPEPGGGALPAGPEQRRVRASSRTCTSSPRNPPPGRASRARCTTAAWASA